MARVARVAAARSAEKCNKKRCDMRQPISVGVGGIRQRRGEGEAEDKQDATGRASTTHKRKKRAEWQWEGVDGCMNG